MNFTQYNSSNNSIAASGFWNDCPIDQIQSGYKAGIYIYDNFTTGNAITAVTSDADLVGLPYLGFNSSGGTITRPDAQFGGLVLTEATADEANFIRSTVQPFQISSLLGTLWFEARVKVSSITNIGMIVGLWDNTACTVDIPLSAANPPIMATTGNFVGFRMLEGAAAIDAIYKADGVSVVAGQTVVTAAGTAVADTYINLGMKAKKGVLTYYVNGIKQTTTKTIPNATGTDFPADVRLGLLFGQKLVATSAGVSTISQWRCAQVV